MRIIRADQIAELVDQAIDAAVNEAGLLPRNQAIELIEQTRVEFVETVEAQQQEIESLRTKLAMAREQLAQFGAVLEGAAPLPEEPTAPEPAPQAPAAAPAEDGTANMLASAVDQLSAAMNTRLDQMSKKLGITTAVEADDVKLGALFEHDDAGASSVESNIDDFQVKSKTSGGIGANLARLKKLKNGGE